MTLGGLALAVGILVDDGTVTIENINYHLEQGKPIEPAIMDGAQQIVIPAFVTLLCLCIVFVPMFQLGGVAGYLFRPMAEAVVFALIGSFILSRTLVPTMANYLHARTRSVSGQPHDHIAAAATLAQSRSNDFSRGLKLRFTRVRDRYRALLSLALGPARRPSSGASWLASCCRSASGRSWARISFPAVDSGQILMHVRAQPGTRIEETARLFDLIEQTVRGIIPPDQLDNIVDNIGLPFSGINMAYQNTGTIGPEDGDALISLKEDHAPTDDRQAAAQPVLPQKFPGATFSFLPADIVSQILNFGLAGADRRAGDRQQSEGQLRLRDRAAQTHPHRSRHCRPAHPAGFQLPADQCRGRSHARRRGRTDPARRRQQLFGHVVRQPAGAPEFLA